MGLQTHKLDKARLADNSFFSDKSRFALSNSDGSGSTDLGMNFTLTVAFFSVIFWVVGVP